jgi:murein DD-endopeptidase MepM/ murein hydrolase activator NlpD
MPRFSLQFYRPKFLKEIVAYLGFLRRYIRRRGYYWFAKFETLKDVLVDLLYKRRGKYTRPFLHFGTVGLIFAVIILGPVLVKNAEIEGEQQASSGVLVTKAYGQSLTTMQAEEVKQFRGGEIITHTVQDGETLSSIAQRYGLQINTIQWENDLADNVKLKPGQELRILPIDGVRHKVQRGETIYTIGKKYSLEGSEVQSMVDYPFNEFLNDETYELATGQFIIVPDGVKPDVVAVKPTPKFAKVLTPDAGAVTGSGSFVWPAAGMITQGYRFYHKAFDIANRAAGPILAADSGTVISAGWDSSGYGNKVMVDHGNGYVTLYGHLSVIQVNAGQRVNRGDTLGQMGSTGRSTGTHLHFEIRKGAGLQNPGDFLK